MAAEQAQLPDDLLINKAAKIEHSVKRKLEEYNKDPATFATDYTNQDADFFNIRRTFNTALDTGYNLIRKQNLGVRQSQNDFFTLPADAVLINISATYNLKKVWFKNTAYHDFQRNQKSIAEYSLNVSITRF